MNFSGFPMGLLAGITGLTGSFAAFFFSLFCSVLGMVLERLDFHRFQRKPYLSCSWFMDTLAGFVPGWVFVQIKLDLARKYI